MEMGLWVSFGVQKMEKYNSILWDVEPRIRYNMLHTIINGL
jgi:hypothetical protein